MTAGFCCGTLIKFRRTEPRRILERHYLIGTVVISHRMKGFTPNSHLWLSGKIHRHSCLPPGVSWPEVFPLQKKYWPISATRLITSFKSARCRSCNPHPRCLAAYALFPRPSPTVDCHSIGLKSLLAICGHVQSLLALHLFKDEPVLCMFCARHRNTAN
jgi:hypothetical protein